MVSEYPSIFIHTFIFLYVDGFCTNNWVYIIKNYAINNFVTTLIEQEGVNIQNVEIAQSFTRFIPKYVINPLAENVLLPSHKAKLTNGNM